ncbi:hypothetical protein HZF05_19215 [Sphingomonas sp. CGMCC 1.13654]|uniref:DUF883 family protein n=1 Tax=Sphingomonas chungangi TaxID=2683589 RepID=A0A838LDJ9_9SPHN|nr:hypothetical protein [Sphingomonas chungangi]MBA2936216.1 hypothetical protein [Sphingomonas chungangi]MVW55601.1 hypothetical protein [Sphingomonas chungangi]
MTETSGSDETQATTRQAIRDGIDDAYAKASKAAHTAVERTKDGLDQAKGKVNDAYASGRERASEAYASARGKAANGFENNPLAALLGGIAIGAVVGALLPRTEREAKALGAVGEKVRGAASEAIEAAKGAGRDKLDELGLSKEHARETMKSLLDGAIAAAGSGATAAIESARKKSA